MSGLGREQCKTRQLYRVDTNNLGPVAVYSEQMNHGFVGLRRKFKMLRLAVEYHADNGEPFGTAYPLEELPEELPAEIELAYGYDGNKALFDWLMSMETKYRRSKS